MVAVIRLFPKGIITNENLTKIDNTESSIHDLLSIWIYLDSRIWTLRNIRKKHDDPMLHHQEFFAKSKWRNEWGTSKDVVYDFKNFFTDKNEEGLKARFHFKSFVTYVHRYISWSVIEPQFEMIFSIAPRLRKKIIYLIKKGSLGMEKGKWDEVESLINTFLQGKSWG